MSQLILTSDASIGDEHNGRRVIEMWDIGTIKETVAPHYDKLIIHHDDFDKAYQMAQKLVKSGLSDTQVVFTDDLNVEPQHVYFNEIYPLSRVKPDNETYLPCGVERFGYHLRWRKSGELCTVVGGYGSGKSTIAQILAFDYLMKHAAADEHVGICSWEDRDTVINDRLCKFVRGKSSHLNKPDADRKVLDALNRTQYVTLPPDADRSIKWLFDRIHFMAKMHNMRMIVIDPYNEFDHEKGNTQSETDYVRDLLKSIRKLIHQLNVIVILVTHVAKDSYGKDGKPSAFRLASAHGSIQFGNKSDRGICVARSEYFDGDHTLIRFDKVKVEGQQFMGNKGSIAMTLDVDNCDLVYDAYVSEQEEFKSIWR
jgi:nicotinamide riboside kinase